MCNVYGILGDAVEAHPGGVLKPRRALVVEFASVRFLSSVSEAPSGLCTAGPSLRLCASVHPVEALLSRLGVGSDEAQALFGQSVEVGGPDPAVTVSAEVVPPAAFYEHDVGSVRVSPQARQGRRVSDSDKPFMRHLYDGVGCLGQPICRTGADGAIGGTRSVPGYSAILSEACAGASWPRQAYTVGKVRR